MRHFAIPRPKAKPRRIWGRSGGPTDNLGLVKRSLPMLTALSAGILPLGLLAAAPAPAASIGGPVASVTWSADDAVIGFGGPVEETRWSVSVRDPEGDPLRDVPVFEIADLRAPDGPDGSGNGTPNSGVTNSSGLFTVTLSESTMDNSNDRHPGGGIQSTFYVVDADRDGEYDASEFTFELTQEYTFLNLLVLGDSYSAGNGAGDYYGLKGCYRSYYNYGTWLGLEITKSGQPVTVTDGACSDARTEHFRKSQDGRPPQLDYLRPYFDAILLTIGGNDAHFTDIVKHCLVGKFRKANHCEDNLERAERMLRNGTIEGRVRTVLTNIMNNDRTSPTAKIVLIGYPHLEGDSRYKLRYGRHGRQVGVGKRLRALVSSANAKYAAIVRSLNEAHPARFAYQSTLSLFDPPGPTYHGLYAKKNNSDRWMVQPELDARLWDVHKWYHPNPRGWKKEGLLLALNPAIPHLPTHEVRASHRNMASLGAMRGMQVSHRLPHDSLGGTRGD